MPQESGGPLVLHVGSFGRWEALHGIGSNQATAKIHQQRVPQPAPKPHDADAGDDAETGEVELISLDEAEAEEKADDETAGIEDVDLGEDAADSNDDDEDDTFLVEEEDEGNMDDLVEGGGKDDDEEQ